MDIEATPAWADYQSRIVQLRKATVDDLTRGVLDKWGRAHDDERRAVLHVLDILLAYVPSIHRDYRANVEQAERLKSRFQADGPLHDLDTLTTNRFDNL